MSTLRHGFQKVRGMLWIYIMLVEDFMLRIRRFLFFHSFSRCKRKLSRRKSVLFLLKLSAGTPYITTNIPVCGIEVSSAIYFTNSKTTTLWEVYTEPKEVEWSKFSISPEESGVKFLWRDRENIDTEELAMNYMLGPTSHTISYIPFYTYWGLYFAYLLRSSTPLQDVHK